MNTAANSSAGVEIDDVQSGALRPRPVPYAGRFIILRVDDRHAGRALLRQLLPVISGGLPSADQSQDAWVTVAVTCQGLKALGVPQESLDSFPQAFREGMAARAQPIGDVGERAPQAQPAAAHRAPQCRRGTWCLTRPATATTPGASSATTCEDVATILAVVNRVLLSYLPRPD